MPNKDTSIAINIQLLIQCSTRTESQALDATQGHKLYIYISIQNDRDDPILSMSQPGQDTQGYNPVTNQRLYTGLDIVSYQGQYRH